MWKDYISASSIQDVYQALAEKKDKARIVAGATDLILEMERGVRKGIETLIDVSRISGLNGITYDEKGWIHLGPLVTHNHCVESKLLREAALPLALACWEVGSPQIRNRGTVAGNLITASPANDTITPLMALDARLVIGSLRGTREVDLKNFYTGVRRTVLEPDEMLVDITFPALKEKNRGTFIKFALRRAQAISLVNTAIVLQMAGDVIEKAAITLGAVAPTIVHAVEAEAFLAGKLLDDETIFHAAGLAVRSARPISDIRGSAGYRRQMAQVIVRRGLKAIRDRQAGANIPENPVLLWGQSGSPGRGHSSRLEETLTHDASRAIVTRINGKECTFESGQEKTLLRLLREDAGLVGTKEGCAEGECGACTVFLDGRAVMSCMVPAPRAHGAEIVTVEGLAQDGKLHPVQQAFIEKGAVQCGYCTPGFLMSAAKLLEERPTPSQDEIRQALTGNLCRCTGYYKIIEAVESAAQKGWPE